MRFSRPFKAYSNLKKVTAKTIFYLLACIIWWSPMASYAGFTFRTDPPAAVSAAPEIQPAVPSPTIINPAITSPAVNPVIVGLDEARIQGITNTILQYPMQTQGILRNYVGIDTAMINFDQFMEIVNRANYQEIYNEVAILYTNRAAFNSGQFTNLNYYQLKPTVAPSEMPAPLSMYRPRFLTSPTFYAGIGVVAAGAGIAALASGGGGGGNSPEPIQDTFGRTMLPDIYDPADFADSEFAAYPLNAIGLSRAQYAYSKGLTGAGVNIGFYDFFSDDSSTDPELSSRIIYRDLNIPADTAFLASDCALAPGNPNACNHGGAVMAYAANARNGAGTVGIAYEANLLMNSVFAVADSRALADNGADIINFSCGGCATLSDLQYIASQGVLMASATGNSGTANPDPSSPATYASLLDYSLIAVTGVYNVGGMPVATAYDKCGTQKEFCMAAYSDQGTSFSAPQIAGAAALIKQGWGFLTVKQISQILLYSARDLGAAGVDSIYGHGLLDLKAATEPIGAVRAMSGGGSAVNFSSSVIQQNQSTAFGNAFSSAKNAQGHVVVVDSFGRDFAVRPQENLVVAQNNKLSADKIQGLGKKINNYKTMAASDRLSFKFSQEQNEDDSSTIASFAEYNVNPATTFTLGFSNDMDIVPVNNKRKFNPFNFISADLFQNGFLKFSDNNQVFHQAIEIDANKFVKTKLSSFYSKNNTIDYFKPVGGQVTSDFASTVLETGFSPGDSLNVNFKNGLTHEFDSLLGTRFSGSFDMETGANTYFTGVDISYDIAPDWNLFGSYLFGATQAKPSETSAFTSVSDLTSDSFAVTATKTKIFGNDAFSLAVGQPTRVRSGYASGLTQHVDHVTGDVSVAEFQQSLVPTGRTLQFQAAYQKELGQDIDMNLALEYESQPYQQDNVDANVSGLAKLVYRFD